MTAQRQVWIPKYRYRRFDFGPELRANRRAISPLRFGPYLTRSGLRRIAEHYGLEFDAVDQRVPKAVKLSTPPRISADRLRRLANYIDRTPKLRGLRRIASAIRRQLVMPDRLRHKSS